MQVGETFSQDDFKANHFTVYLQIQEFIQCSGGPCSFYGFCEDTLDSLLLKVLPVTFTHIGTSESTCQPSPSVDNFESPQKQQIYIVQVLTEALTLNFNFQVSNQILWSTANGWCKMLVRM